MSIVENIVHASDGEAIAALHAAFDRQRAAFATDRDPSLAERRARIEALMGMMAANRERISAALAADFGSHPVGAAELIEVLGVLGRAPYVLAHLEEWMAPSVRETDPALLGTATASVRYQPKGVIGNIVPWNFPFDIGVGPVIEMLAAGNRVILKPSDYTPACGALLAEIVAAAFDPAIVHVANGGVDLARAFAALPWDHLLYTGSPGVGRAVMTAAAANLTPVTLELGGKCPAILTPGSVSAANVGSIVGTKTIKNGQMCVSVDYCLVPRADLETFVDLARAHMASTAPDLFAQPGLHRHRLAASPRAARAHARRGAAAPDADRAAGGRRHRRSRDAAHADIAGRRSGRRLCADEGGDLRADPAAAAL